MNDVFRQLLNAADEAKEKAYSPYSRYKVGAALLAKGGEIITGCNVENAVYGLAQCAERAAVCTAVSRGYQPGDFEAIAIVANAPDFSPCGSCRQVLHEFGTDIKVIFSFEGEMVIRPVSDLLPKGFTP